MPQVGPRRKEALFDASNISDRDLGWIAGIIDGEGHITSSEAQKPRVRVAMCHKGAIEKLHDIVPVGPKLYTQHDERSRPLYVWDMRRKNSLMEFLPEIVNDLTEKRETAMNVIENLNREGT